MNQNTAVLNELKRAKSKGRTVKQLREKTGAERVGARIYDLRLKGYPITTVYQVVYNRFGHATKIGRYILTGIRHGRIK